MAQTDKQKDIDDALSLYRRIVDLCEQNKRLNAQDAHWVIRAAKDAEQLFGTSHQEEKIKIEVLKQKAELVIAPRDFNEARVRSEGFLLQWLWPKNSRVRVVLLVVLGLGSLATFFGVREKLFDAQENANTHANTAPPSTATPVSTPNSSPVPSPTPKAITTQQTPPAITAQAPDDRASQLKQQAERLMNNGKYEAAKNKLNQALAIPGISERMISELQALRLTAITMASNGPTK